MRSATLSVLTPGLNATWAPTLSPIAMIKGEQRFLSKRRNKLNAEKWINSSLLVDHLRQRRLIA